MRSYHVTIHESAETEIREAFEFIKDDSSANAERWLTELGNVIRSLETMPERCSKIAESEAFDEELRQIVHYSHRIIFVVDHDEFSIEILHCRHAARDQLG